MRARMFALVGVVAVFVPTVGGQEFKPFDSADGRYKAVFPGAVKSDTKEIKAGKERLTLTIDMVELKGNTSFLVSYIDVTDEAAKLPAAERLNKTRDGNKGATGKLVAEADVAVGREKYPGRDILLETPDGYIRNRAVVVGKRLYQVMVQGTKEVVSSPSADRFIGSFEITK